MTYCVLATRNSLLFCDYFLQAPSALSLSFPSLHQSVVFTRKHIHRPACSVQKLHPYNLFCSTQILGSNAVLEFCLYFFDVAAHYLEKFRARKIEKIATYYPPVNQPLEPRGLAESPSPTSPTCLCILVERGLSF